ncbi:MAG: hypothetical protein U5L96_10135 [Owenweeksia sp.]|nr:hypothetical protein [Owenweeksia sp.]
MNSAQSTSTIKTGLEYRIGPTYLRGGYQFRESNFENSNIFHSDRSTYSAGFGYKDANFSIDISYAWSSYSNNSILHTLTWAITWMAMVW